MTATRTSGGAVAVQVVSPIPASYVLCIAENLAAGALTGERIAATVPWHRALVKIAWRTTHPANQGWAVQFFDIPREGR